MSSQARIDPRVEEILREIASDPRSSLLRVPRPRVARELFATPARASATSAGLSAAERELLRVHRAEVASLLKEACKRRLAGEARSRDFLSRRLGTDREVEIIEQAELVARARALRSADLSLAHDPLDDLDPLGLLERAITDRAGQAPSITQLALASLRLEPEDSTRICLGLDLVFSSQPSTGLEVLARVLDGCTSPLVRSIALANTAFAAYRLGDLSRSLELHARSVSSAEPASASVWWWLLMALRLQDSAAAERAAALLRAETDPDDGWLSRSLSALGTRMASGERTLAREDLLLLARLVPSAEGAIRSLLNDRR